ncbi:MAG: hypothetical protein MUP98_09065 [Candidatus Aminicenantes bacterium]|nr:hypothetical protein [Candidatus Aminicenantes bacterium]
MFSISNPIFLFYPLHFDTAAVKENGYSILIDTRKLHFNNKIFSSLRDIDTGHPTLIQSKQLFFLDKNLSCNSVDFSINLNDARERLVCLNHDDLKRYNQT